MCNLLKSISSQVYLHRVWFACLKNGVFFFENVVLIRTTHGTLMATQSWWQHGLNATWLKCNRKTRIRTEPIIEFNQLNCELALIFKLDCSWVWITLLISTGDTVQWQSEANRMPRKILYDQFVFLDIFMDSFKLWNKKIVTWLLAWFFPLQTVNIM